MSEQPENDNKNRGGRPATGQGVLIGVRLGPDMLEWLDERRAKLDPMPSRPEMIRRVLAERKALK